MKIFNNNLRTFPILLVMCIIGLGACKKENEEPSILEIIYPMLLEDMVLDCPEEESLYFMKATIKGQQVCYYDGIDNRQLSFGIRSLFTTSSPSVSEQTEISDIRRGASLKFNYLPEPSWAEDIIRIKFPEVEITRDTFAYLDSIFAIPVHNVRANETDRGDFLIDFQLAEPAQNNGTLLYSISSRFGAQTNSFVRFNEVRKTTEDGDVYYYIDMDFECNLYHWPQYGKEGLWSELTEGKVIAKFKV